MSEMTSGSVESVLPPGRQSKRKFETHIDIDGSWDERSNRYFRLMAMASAACVYEVIISKRKGARPAPNPHVASETPWDTPRRYARSVRKSDGMTVTPSSLGYRTIGGRVRSLLEGRSNHLTSRHSVSCYTRRRRPRMGCDAAVRYCIYKRRGVVLRSGSAA